MLIGKTANWLLRHSVQRCVKSRRWVVAHERNHAICWSCPKMSYCSRSCRHWFTALNFESWAFSRIYGHFHQHFTAHVQKRLFMNFRYKFGHRRSIRLPRFPIRVQNFRDLATFSVDFCILYAECQPYFYFRFVWPADLESRPLYHTRRPPRR